MRYRVFWLKDVDGILRDGYYREHNLRNLKIAYSDEQHQFERNFIPSSDERVGILACMTRVHNSIRIIPIYRYASDHTRQLSTAVVTAEHGQTWTRTRHTAYAVGKLNVELFQLFCYLKRSILFMFHSALYDFTSLMRFASRSNFVYTIGILHLQEINTLTISAWSQLE